MMGEGLSDNIKWVIRPDEASTASISTECQKLPEPKYSVFGERIRHVAPSAMQCAMFCGGKQCKYCNAAKFKKEPGQDAINGLYSAWVTKDILATSRPSTEAINQYKIIEQFQSHGIKAIINLQHPGEHAACGFGLEDSRFSYVPQHFMDNDVFFYNFGWNDYGVRSLQSILDMVKVFDFALSNGKAAVHCHAGLGRTGVLIACYLIYSMRSTSHEAILKVREARPKAIQTRGQINCVNDFEAYIRPMWITFSENDDCFTLKHFMSRQRSILHGEEARTLRFLPKIIYIICQRLLQQAEIDFDLSRSAITTRFSFMLNSSFQMNSSEGSTDTNNETRTRKLSEDLQHHHHHHHHQQQNDAERRYSDIGDLKKQTSKGVKMNVTLDSQFKASSSPNILETHDENFLNASLPPQLPPSKKGGIMLEPIQSSKKEKRKKKRSILDRVKDGSLTAATDSKTSMPLIRQENDLGNDAYIDSSSTSNYLYKERLRNSINKPDSMSLASFSSGSNEGLSQHELVLKHLAFRPSDIKISHLIERYKRKLNSEDTAWDSLAQETNLGALSGLLWSWLSQLDSPIISVDAIEILKENLKDPEEASENIDKDVWKLMKFFLTFLSKLDGKEEHVIRILRRLSMIMTNSDLPRELIERNGTSVEHQQEDNNKSFSSNSNSSIVFFQFISNWLRILKDDM